MAIAARIYPNDVRLTLEQAIPGGMSLEDYSLMREVIAAIREDLPEADQLQPGAVFQHVLGALQDCCLGQELHAGDGMDIAPQVVDCYVDQSDGIETCEKRLYLVVIKGRGRHANNLSPLMPDRDQQSDHRDARYRRKDGLKRA